MPGYPVVDPYDSGFLPVGEIHKVHYEQYGKSDGKPVVFLHGGPGASTSVFNTTFFNLSIYRLVLFDQRGAGKSTPTCELRENTTQHLIADIEALRNHLCISKWHMVFGGSWGSTLALLYAQAHPDRVSSLVLRGIFLLRKSELEWGHPITGGSVQLFPDAAEEFLSHLSEAEKEDWERSIYMRLLSDDRSVRVEAARILNTYDFKRSSLVFDPESLETLDDEVWSLHHATLLMHYFLHNGWIREGQILEREEMAKIRNIPCVIVQGRYDMVCPPQAAWDLHKVWPEARLVIVPDAGHSATERGTLEQLVKATDEFAQLAT